MADPATLPIKLKQILGLGIAGDDSIPDHVIKRVLDKQIADARASGFNLHFLLFKSTGTESGDPKAKITNPDAIAAQLDELRGLLKSRHWDGYMLGFGLRGNHALTEGFEEALNLCVELGRGEAKFAFNVSPDTTVESIVRISGKR